MRRIPVDANRVQLFAGSAVTPVAVYENSQRVEGAQAKDDNGTPLWSITLGGFEDAGLFTMRVKFAAATAPTIAIQTPVKVDGLVATPVGDKVYFAAASVSAAKQG